MLFGVSSDKLNTSVIKTVPYRASLPLHFHWAPLISSLHRPCVLHSPLIASNHQCAIQVMIFASCLLLAAWYPLPLLRLSVQWTAFRKTWTACHQDTGLESCPRCVKLDSRHHKIRILASVLLQAILLLQLPPRAPWVENQFSWLNSWLKIRSNPSGDNYRCWNAPWLFSG